MVIEIKTEAKVMFTEALVFSFFVEKNANN